MKPQPIKKIAIAIHEDNIIDVYCADENTLSIAKERAFDYGQIQGTGRPISFRLVMSPIYDVKQVAEFIEKGEL